MSYLTHLECTHCGRTLDADALHGACPDDGRPLYSRYDLDAVARGVRREGFLGLLFGERLEWPIVLPGILAVRLGRDGHLRRFVRVGRVVLRVDRDRRDEYVLLRMLAQRVGRLANPAWQRGGIVDHDVPVVLLEGRVVADGAVPL